MSNRAWLSTGIFIILFYGGLALLATTASAQKTGVWAQLSALKEQTRARDISIEPPEYGPIGFWASPTVLVYDHQANEWRVWTIENYLRTNPYDDYAQYWMPVPPKPALYAEWADPYRICGIYYVILEDGQVLEITEADLENYPGLTIDGPFCDFYPAAP